MRHFILLLVLLGVGNKVLAQKQTRFVWESMVALNYKIADSWTFNTSLGKRSIWSTVGSNRDSNLRGDFSFVEVNHFATYRINTKIKVSAGYKYRWREPFEGMREYEHRLTQQFAYTHRAEVVRLVSRARAEQRIGNDSFAQRYRYRLSADMPLSGETLDAREFYLVASTEILYEAVDVEINTWENRISGSIGYLITPNLKAELNLTYRLEDITRSTQDFVFIHTNLFVNLK